MPEVNQRTITSTGARRIGVATALAAVAFVGVSAIHHRVGAQSDAAAADPDSDNVSVSADLSERKLTITNNGNVVATYGVAVGRDSKPTPTGNYSIRKIVWNPAWIPPDQPWAKKEHAQAPGAPGNPMKIVKVFFKEPDYYIHGTNQPESIGEAESHGCLRMDPDDAYRVARYLMEHGGQPRDESWFQRILHFRSQTKTVYLDHPIPMTVVH
jgi:lipoprotein-anchoring transpeptidase ErfK/SrfK